MKFEIEKSKEHEWYRLIIKCDCGVTQVVPLEDIPIYKMERIFNCKLFIRKDSSTGRAPD